jgi:hypothetical protein
VDCNADCNDLTTDGAKCFSKLACEPSLLFFSDYDSGLDCNTDAQDTQVLKPIEVVDQAENSTATDVSVSRPKCPGNLTFIYASVKPDTLFIGERICKCITESDLCTTCEVECNADCNDLTTDGAKCFSELACEPTLLFEVDYDYGLECNTDGQVTKVLKPIETVNEGVVQAENSTAIDVLDSGNTQQPKRN